MIFKNKKITISSAILKPFLTIITLFILFNITVYTIVTNLYTDYNKLYNQSIPEIAHIMSGVDDFQKAYSHVYRILNENIDPIFLSEIRQINENLDNLYENFEKHQKNSTYQKDIESVLSQFIEFKSILNDTSFYLEQRSEIMRTRLNYRKALRYISSQLNALDTKNHSQQKHLLLLNETLMHLVLLTTEAPIFYGSKIYENAKKNLLKIEKYQKNLIDNPDQTSQVINKLTNEITILATKKQGIFDLFFEFEQVQNKRTSILIHIDVLYNEIIQFSNMLFLKISQSAEEHHSSFEQHLQYLFYFIILSFVLVVASFYFIYKFLTKYIAGPLTRLNVFVKERGNCTECEFCNEGAVEVQEIAEAIFHFTEQIEDRERKLIESHENLESQVEERTREISELSEKIICLQEEERFKLAAELHDDIGSSMGTIKFSIERSLKLLRQSDMGQAQDSLDSSIQIVKSVARQLRRIQTDLRPPHLDIGLLKTLEWYVKDYRIAHPEIIVQADFFFDELMLSSSLRIVTFRIIQESMNNINKHSNATKVNIQILHEDDFRIIIKDNGKGFCLNELNQNKGKKGHGLRNIHERVAISGGQLNITSNEGQGSEITAIWKLNK